MGISVKASGVRQRGGGGGGTGGRVEHGEESWYGGWDKSIFLLSNQPDTDTSNQQIRPCYGWFRSVHVVGHLLLQASDRYRPTRYQVHTV